MDDPDNLNGYWDSLPERTPEDDGWDAEPAAPKLRVVDESFESEPETPLALPGAIDVGSWHGKNAPERSFVFPGWVARGHAGLLSGMEGVGKSLAAQQMATCAAVGIPFLGLAVEQCNAAYITCEDSEDELWRRQEAINRMLGITMADLDGKLFLRSLLGQIGNELGTFDAQGRLTPSDRFKQVEAEAERFDWQFVVLDNAAHLFAGNENARHDVAAFLGLLERLSQRINGACLLLAHPNKQFAQGNSQGNEYSGSTGWSAHVRNRLFLDYAPAGDDGVPPNDDARILRKSKANYGKRGEEVSFIWHEWAFTLLDDLPEDTARELTEIARVHGENERFLQCLDKATEEKRNVSPSPAASNYAPRVFAKMTIANGMPLKSFELAMERLLHLDVIANEQPVFQRPNRTWATGLGRVSECTNPCTKPAQSGAQSLHKAASPQRHSGALHSAPSTTYIGGRSGAPHSMYDQEPPAWLDEAPPWEPGPDDWRDNPLLNGGDR